MTELECRPLRTLKEIEEWTSEDVLNKLKQSTICLRKKGHVNERVPRTLVCHDMRGGYLEDRFIQGDSDQKSYNFYHWQLIDIFVYFSHNLVTIPPVTWINAAHRNGVKILGTFITEWDDGFATCKEFLSSESSLQALADKMVTMTTFYKFDGWLINIENKIEEQKVSNLCKFVEYLTLKLHEALPESLVIWYDSVITTGELKWQDQLNDTNSMFFDACDGIFLNYCWNSEKLLNSKTSSMSKERPLDVYVGIDVFGRGCLGDGGYNTIEALTAVRQYSLSAAIFAQGWVYEKYGKDDFIDNENRFWDLLSDLCPTSVWRNGYLSSSFCLGAGRSVYLNGKVLHGSQWYNINLQDIQPFFRRKQAVSQQSLQPLQNLDPCFDCAYLGGSCLTYQGELPADGMPQLFRLFDLEIKCNDSYIISYTYKTNEVNRVFLEIEGTRDNERKLFIFPPDTNQDGELLTFSNTSLQNTPEDNSKKSRYNDVIIQPKPVEDVLQKVCDQICLPEKDNGWETRWYILDSKHFEDITMTSILCGISSQSKENQTVHVGQVQVFPNSLLRVPTINNIQCTQLIDNITCISWTCSHPLDVNYYIVYHEGSNGYEYLGRSATTDFVTPDITSFDKSSTFGIQAVLNIGLVTNVIKSNKS